METRLEINEVTTAQLADDAFVRELWEVHTRSQREGRASMPTWSLRELAGSLRTPDSGERQEIVQARDAEGRLLGTAVLWLPLLDNTDKAWFEVDVDPAVRRRGVGSALVAEVERRVRGEGRALVMGETHLPAEGREEHGHARFARAVGFEPANYEVVRHLDLPVDEDRLAGWAAAATGPYTFETHAGAVPEDLLGSLCVLLGQLAVDAPTGSVDFEEEQVTPERYAGLVASTEAMGRVRLETVALSPEREVVAQTTLAIPAGEGEELLQWGTFVHREHRGHHLGLAVKAINLQQARLRCPGARFASTQNAEDNGYMVAINEQIGFRPVEVSAEFVKRF